MPIQYEGLALPVSKSLAEQIVGVIKQKNITNDSITINFRDPTYSAEQGGFHPVEIRIEKRSGSWQFCYITDFCYVGIGYNVELTKDLDFDFKAGVFQNLFGTFPIEQATDMYQIWESNFLHYWQEMDVFSISCSTS